MSWEENSNIKKRTEYFLLLFALSISALLRYPTAPHIFEKYDAHFYTMLAGSINRFGQARWTIHMASYFGQYPFSSGVGYPLLLSSVSQMAGVPIETGVLILTFLLTLIGIIGMFLLLKRLIALPLLSFIGAFSFAMMPTLLWYSSETLTSRVVVIYVIPLFLLFLLNSIENKSGKKYVPLSLITLLFLFMFHKTAYFLMIILVIYVLCVRIYYVKKYTPIRARKYKKIIIPTLFLGTFLIGVFLAMRQGTPYENGFIKGTGSLIYIINATTAFIGSTNVIVLAIPFSILFLGEKTYSRSQLFLILSTLAVFPLMQFGIYAISIIPILLVIISTYGLIWLRYKGNRNMFMVSIVILMLLTPVFGGIMMERRGINPLGNDGWLYTAKGPKSLSAEEFSTAIYSKTLSPPQSSFMSNKWIDGRVFQSYIQSPCLPSQARMDPITYLIYGHLSPKDVKQNTHTIPITDFKEFIAAEGPYAAPELYHYYDIEMGHVLRTNAGDLISIRIMDNYNTTFILVNKEFPTQFYYSWQNYGPRPSKFFQTLPEENYKIFESTDYFIYSPFSYTD